MDQLESKACEIPNDAKHLHASGKENRLSNSWKTIAYENRMLEKQGSVSDQELNSSDTESLPEKEKCPNYDDISATDCVKGYSAESSKPQSSVSMSRNLTAELGMYDKKKFTEGTSGAISLSKELISPTVLCDRKSNDGESCTQSMEGIDSTQHISLKSDISLETGPSLNGESNELYAKRALGNWLNASKDDIKSIMHATFHEEVRIEYSSSQSANVSTSFNSSVTEPATGSVVLGMAAQITQKSVENIRARDSKKVLEMIGDQNSLIVEKVDVPKPSLVNQKDAEISSQQRQAHSYQQDDALGVFCKGAKGVEQKGSVYRKASGSTSSIEERNGNSVHLSSVDAADPDKNTRLTQSGQVLKLCNEEDSFCSPEEVVDPGTENKHKPLLVVKGQSEEMSISMIHVSSCGPHGQGPSSFTVKPDDVAAYGQTAFLSRFDLNEDIHANEVDHPNQLRHETASSYNVIHVVAKCGVPSCLHMTPLKFEGELGWKGSSATSAFRPASLFKGSSTVSSTNNNCGSKHSQCFAGFDLNVTAAEDDISIELTQESVAALSAFPFKDSPAEISSKWPEKHSIDLNCLGENGDDFAPSSSTVMSTRHLKVDFDLNDNPSDTCNDSHLPGQGRQPLGNKLLEAPAATTFMGNSRHGDLNCVRPTYWADLNSMQGFGYGGAPPFLLAAPNLLQPAEQMQRVVPFHANLPYTAHTLPSHSYPYSNPFCFGPTNPLSSTMHSSSILSYTTDSHTHGINPQILVPGKLPTFLGPAHLSEFPHGRHPNDMTNNRSIFDTSSWEHNSENGSRGDNARQFLFPSKTSSTGEQMKSFNQVSLSATAMKRREPEGGWDSFQLGHRHLTSWR
ncbi:unnamed protein product [Ilex paraguariensis]|uniref:Uncharacterized protein n=1 Tax=Ilex paraguariensis TaxID=185542 RepID=A0ABC8R0A3_9AQUA